MNNIEINEQALETFFKAVEKRAFRMTEFAISDPDEALDLIQNSMLKLVQRYADRDENEWTLLFYRILQNEIKDWKRKAWVRGWFGFIDPETEWIEDKSVQACPDRVVHQDAINSAMHAAIKQLPWRQQQAFLLRSWEGLNVKQTAKVMACTTGSVKTHYSRAVTFLRKQLAEDEL